MRNMRQQSAFHKRTPMHHMRSGKQGETEPTKATPMRKLRRTTKSECQRLTGSKRPTESKNNRNYYHNRQHQYQNGQSSRCKPMSHNAHEICLMQHNCPKNTEIIHSILEQAKDKADIVIIQEPRVFIDPNDDTRLITISHPHSTKSTPNTNQNITTEFRRICLKPTHSSNTEPGQVSSTTQTYSEQRQQPHLYHPYTSST